MQIITCSSCKKDFGVRVPKKDIENAKEAEKTNVFLVAKCPGCKLLTRFKRAPFDVKTTIEEGEYIGKMELPKDNLNLN